jgi:hypothetical protein
MYVLTNRLARRLCPLQERCFDIAYATKSYLSKQKNLSEGFRHTQHANRSAWKVA